MKTLFRKEWYVWLLMLIPFIYSIFIYSQLPESVPIHWNINGEVDGYGSRFFVAFIAPFIPVILYIFMLVLPKFDPRKQNYKLFEGPYRATRIAVVVLLTGVYFMSMRTAMGDEIPVERILPPAIFILLMIMGNYMSNIRSNYFFGIRTPWGLENETVWRKTHQFGGKLWFFGSLIGLFLVLIFHAFAPYIIFTFVAVFVIVPFIYSYLQYKQLKNQNQ